MITATILVLFGLSLVSCIVLKLSVLYALTFGLILFFSYGLMQKHSFFEMLRMSLSGILAVKNILVTFILIGMITALWRCCGTIPYIVYHSSALCTPKIMVLLTFLLCCLLSVLMGTSVGASATIGVICMSAANAMGISPMLTGAAVLSGAYFGDRCSPMSTSALLVATLTDTDIYDNIRRMTKSSIFPFILSCLVYLGLGAFTKAAPGGTDVCSIFAQSFNMHFSVLLPALLILLLSLFKLNVKLTMSASIIAAATVALLVQRVSPSVLLQAAVFGFHPAQSELDMLIGGGGIVSMTKVFAIVCLSSCYSGIFQGTGFLDDIQAHVDELSKKLTPYVCILTASVLTAMISCSQTLSVMLTHELCEHTEPDKSQLACDLENTAVMVSALIPWSIACAVPLSTVGAPQSSALLACYLYLVPLWNLFVSLRRGKRATAHSVKS